MTAGAEHHGGQHESHFRKLTRATPQLLEQVEALPDHERSELVAELARRVALAPHDAPTDEDLTAAADRRYVELDRSSFAAFRRSRQRAEGMAFPEAEWRQQFAENPDGTVGELTLMR